MSKIYDEAFKVGVGFTVLLFVISNFISFVINVNDFLDREMQVIKFSGGGYRFGFPFEIYRNFYGNPSDVGVPFDGLIMNTTFWVILGFIIGVIFKFVWAKIAAWKLK